MRALTAGLRSVGLCVSRRLPRRAPAGLPQNKENPTKLQGDDIAHAVVLPSSSVGEESLSPNHPDTSSRF